MTMRTTEKVRADELRANDEVLHEREVRKVRAAGWGGDGNGVVPPLARGHVRIWLDPEPLAEALGARLGHGEWSWAELIARVRDLAVTDCAPDDHARIDLEENGEDGYLVVCDDEHQVRLLLSDASSRLLARALNQHADAQEAKAVPTARTCKECGAEFIHNDEHCARCTQDDQDAADRGSEDGS